MLSNLLWMSAIALALIIAGLAYRHGSRKGKVVFGLEVVVGVVLIALAATACSELQEAVQADRQSDTTAASNAKSDTGQGAARIQQILQDYETNSLRAEDVYVGQTMLVGGEIKAFDEYWLGRGVTIQPGDDPNKGTLPQVWLEHKVSLIFASNDARTWLHKMSVGDQIAVQCLFGGFNPHSMEGPLKLTECRQVPE